MGLVALSEGDWLQAEPDIAARTQGFAAFPQGAHTLPQGEKAVNELAAMLGVQGDLKAVAAAHHEDMCVLTRADGEEVYRLVAAAVAWPSDWRPAEKMGLPLRALHAPIQGYEEQLASGVDQFMARLKPGPIFGRSNWFIAPTGDRRWLADGPAERSFAHVTRFNAGEALFARCERQTLRRLPDTGAIVFTIGIYVAPLSALPAQSVAKLSEAVRELVEGEGERRGAGAYADALIGYAAGAEME